MEQGIVVIPLQDGYKDPVKECSVRRILGIICCLAVLGCAHMRPNHTIHIEDCAEAIAHELSRGLEGSYSGVSILVSTPVEAATYAPSDFGLVLQEFLIGSLVKKNVNVVDVQLRKEPYITCEDGLISLSRDAGRLKAEFTADVIIVCTYVVREHEVVITSRAIDFTSSDVITSATTILAMSPLVSDLLDTRRQIRIYER